MRSVVVFADRPGGEPTARRAIVAEVRKVGRSTVGPIGIAEVPHWTEYIGRFHADVVEIQRQPAGEVETSFGDTRVRNELIAAGGGRAAHQPDTERETERKPSHHHLVSRVHRWPSRRPKYF